MLSGSRGKKTVNTKVVDDKLKIIDEVPSSAVEMFVKEKVSGPYGIFCNSTIMSGRNIEIIPILRPNINEQKTQEGLKLK